MAPKLSVLATMALPPGVVGAVRRVSGPFVVVGGPVYL
ncbi:hypothetical protein TOK_0914 [Pseudonocardia sp. N23]|nr:hypothetical protein TOK_0914 [Pseudonocardia sp. N23]